MALIKERTREAAQTPREEFANSLTHGVGLLFGLAGLVLLIVHAALRGSALHIVTCAVFGSTIVLMYMVSTLYHSTPASRRKRIFRRLDHCCIYVLIAGTYTPIVLVALGGVWGWALFGLAWGIAGLGIAANVMIRGRRFGHLTTASYWVMGCLVLLAARPLLEALSQADLAWILGGGMAYLVGTVIYSFDHRIPYGHAVFHVFVLAGTGLHYVAVFSCAIPA